MKFKLWLPGRCPVKKGFDKPIRLGTIETKQEKQFHIDRVKDSRETAVKAAPKGKAKTLRQKDRIRTILRKVRLFQLYAKGATGGRRAKGNLSGKDGGRRRKGLLSPFHLYFVIEKEGYGRRKMSGLKRTCLYQEHLDAGATMVDFGGWEMPIQYREGILKEHLYTRCACSVFDVSHMGRILVEGPDRVEFLQHVLTSNAAELAFNQAQYCILSDENGFALDDAYLHRFEEDRYFLVVNASNMERDYTYLLEKAESFDCTLTDLSAKWAAIAVQGPRSEEYLQTVCGKKELTRPKKNALGTVNADGRLVLAARTGYTGEPVGYEIYVPSEDAALMWNRLIALGAKPAGLGARDTLRLEACLPLYGHEMGNDASGKPIPIFSVPAARIAVSLVEEKGKFIGREALARQQQAVAGFKDGDYSGCGCVPKRILPIVLTDHGVMRAGMPVFRGEEQVGWITSGTMVPYWMNPEDPNGGTAKRSIGMCYVNSDVKTEDALSVDIRGKRIGAAVVKRHLDMKGPVFARPVIYPAGC